VRCTFISEKRAGDIKTTIVDALWSQNTSTLADGLRSVFVAVFAIGSFSPFISIALKVFTIKKSCSWQLCTVFEAQFRLYKCSPHFWTG
jgi:hypothetical protein